MQEDSLAIVAAVRQAITEVLLPEFATLVARLDRLTSKLASMNQRMDEFNQGMRLRLTLGTGPEYSDVMELRLRRRRAAKADSVEMVEVRERLEKLERKTAGL